MVRLILRLMVAILLAGAASGQTLHSTSELPSRHLIDGVPFTRQMPNYCGPASLSSLLAYWNMPLDQKTIAKTVFDTQASTTNGSDLLLYCLDRGLPAYTFNGSLPELKKMISAGYPALVLQEMSRTWHEGHFRIVVGYDDTNCTVTLRDGVDSSYVVLPYSEFDHLWSKRGRWALVTTPSDRDAFADVLGRKNSVLHMDLAQAYLRRNDWRRAEDEALKALKIEPRNGYAKGLLTRAKSHKN